MRKSLALASLVLSFVVAACSDAPTKAPDLVRSAVPLARDLAGDIDAMILQFFPRGLETATGTKWYNVVLELGQWDAVHNTWTGTYAAQGRKHLLDLSKFIQLKTSSVEGPSLCTATILTNCETQQHAAGRLLLAMNLYVYSGPTVTVPEPTPTTDLTVAIVPAGQAATVQAPSKQAGVIIPTGGTSEDRVIVVARNEQAYPKCSGPLSAYTTRCTYPRYYRIESFPPLPLNTPGRFAVCDYRGGDNGALDALHEVTVHERLRLAHQDPALHGGRRLGTENGAQYVDNIEVLPLIGVDVPGQQTNAAVCNEIAWAPTHDGVLGLAQVALHSVGSAVGKLLTPKELYAYDQGVEHSAIDFSDFGNVDPASQPDLSVSSPSAPASAFQGSTISLSYTVENRSRSNGGEATGASADTTATAYLSADNVWDGEDTALGSVQINALGPDQSQAVTQFVTLPPEGTGARYLIVKVAPSPAVAEVRLDNNQSSPTPITIDIGSGFEVGEQAWSPSGFWNVNTLTGLTNVDYPVYVSTFNTPDVAGGDLPLPIAGSRSAWYGQASTGNYIGSHASYDAAGSGGISADVNYGSITSPAFTVPNVDSPVQLQFKTWWEIEGVNPCCFDIMSVEIVDAEGNVTALRHLNPSSDPTDESNRAMKPYTSGGYNVAPVWQDVAVDISNFRGQTVRIQFSFNTGDQAYNSFRGWIVDQVAVRAVPPSLVALRALQGAAVTVVPASQMTFPKRTQ